MSDASAECICQLNDALVLDALGADTRSEGPLSGEEMMQTSHVAVLAAAAFAILSWHNVDSGAGWIELDLRARADREIAPILEETDEIRLRIDGRDLIIEGTMLSEAKRDEAESRLKELRGVRTVTNLVEIAETAELVAPASSRLPVTAVPYRLVVTLTSTDMVMDGLVRDEPTRIALLAAAADRSIDGSLRETLEVEPNTHPQWSQATQEIVQAVVSLQDVEVQFTDHEISVKGRAGSPDERDRALLAIRSAVPYGVILQTELTAPLSVAATQCEQRFTDLLAQRPVVFLETSTALLPGSRDLLDSLAVTLQSCPDARIEVAGYAEPTSDYGMALRSSQARAEIIEDGLITRGVDASRLSAIGYGLAETERAEPATVGQTPSPQIALIVRGY